MKERAAIVSNKSDFKVVKFKVIVQFETEGNDQNEIVGHMDRSTYMYCR